jgi:hypothetical protein
MLLVQEQQVKRFFQKETRNLIDCTHHSKALPEDQYPEDQYPSEWQ